MSSPRSGCLFSCTEMYISLPFALHTEEYNDTWKVAPLGWGKGLFQEYDRPVYVYQGGHPLINDSESDATFLIYSGNRWLIHCGLSLYLSSLKGVFLLLLVSFCLILFIPILILILTLLTTCLSMSTVSIIVIIIV